VITQISVFLENESGRLAEVTKTLNDAKVNLRAITIADAAEYGILRLVPDEPRKALAALEAADFTARATDVIAVEVADKPGELYRVMDLFRKNDVNIEYLYASLEKNRDNAVIIFKVEDAARGMQIIEANGLVAVSKF
jgi:hypothetical protein